jgi:hypothetical protein
MNNPPKAQHYYPRFNLNYFTDSDELVFVHDKKTGTYKKLHPKAIAFINNFYTFTHRNGEKDYSMEKFLAVVEEQVAPILKKLHEKKFTEITDDNKISLSFYVAFLHQRTPTFRKGMNASLEDFHKQMLRLKSSYTEGFTRTLERAGVLKEGDDKEKKVRELQKFIEEDQYSIKIPQEYSIQLMAANIKEFAVYFENLYWNFLIAPDNAQFITSDNPFTMVQTNKDMTMFGSPMVGYGVPGTDMTIPLTPKICLLISPRERAMKATLIDRELVKVVNKRTILNSDKYVFAQNEALLKKLVQFYQSRH